MFQALDASTFYRRHPGGTALEAKSHPPLVRTAADWQSAASLSHAGAGKMPAVHRTARKDAGGSIDEARQDPVVPATKPARTPAVQRTARKDAGGPRRGVRTNG